MCASLSDLLKKHFETSIVHFVDKQAPVDAHHPTRTICGVSSGMFVHTYQLSKVTCKRCLRSTKTILKILEYNSLSN